MIQEKNLSSPIMETMMNAFRGRAVATGLDWDSMTPSERFSFAEQYSSMIADENKAREEKQREREQDRRREELEAQRRREISIIEGRIPLKYQKARISDFSPENPVIGHIMNGDSCLFTGGPGIGKTHLIWAVARNLVEKGELASEITVINLQDLVCDIKENGANNWAKYTKLKYGKVEHLFIDEFDKTYGSLTDYVVISDLVSYRYDNLKQTVVAGNGGTETALMILGAAAFSRLTGKSDGGAYFPLKGEDRRR